MAFQATPAEAIVYVMPTDESMVDRSPIIVVGEVLAVQPRPDGEFPTTDYLFAVDEVLKGFVAGSGIMVRQPGGVAADGTAMSVMGLPMLAEGDRVLLFLHPEESGAHAIVEYGLGMFFEARIGDRVFLLREPSLRGEIVLPGGSAASDRARRRGYRDGEAFKRWIADRAAGAERPSDYFAKEPPERLTAVESPFRLTMFGCDAGTLPARWRNFDRGESVGFEVYSGGQPGIAGGGLSQVRAAMRVWNADSGSNVNLRFAETTVAPRLLGVDGDNSITFEDPHDEIEGAFVPSEGGVLALTSTWSTCGAAHSVGGLRAREIPQANLTTQDGYQSYLRQFDSRTAEQAFQNVMAHELGHALGIDHPCEPEESSCDSNHEYRGALMWWRSDPNRDLGTALHSDDRAAVHRLYPDETAFPAPDLVVESPRSTEASQAPGGAFRFAATVRNSGDGGSDATTLRYYRSSDSRITTSDTPVGTDPVSALSASATDRQSIGQRAPSTPGTYYYGACVDSVSGESDTTNNCSSGVPISVAGATASCSGDTCLLQGERFRVKARYSKAGAPSQSAGAVEAALANSAGLFSAESDSPELLVRIVNQCRTTGYWEVYAGVASDADFSVAVRHVETNELKWFRTRDGQSVADTEAFACTRSDDRASPADPGGGTGGAACSGVTCLLQEDRFRVKSWYAHDGGSSQAADAISVDLGESAGLFAFDSGNPELLVRIADTCSTSGYWTVYAGTASDADFSVAIRDTETNELKWFRSQGGQSVADAEAFPCTGSDNGTPPGDPDDSPCSGDTCLLQGERFRVKARYSKAGAPSQSAGAIEAALADSAGLFSAESDSPELLVRIVNRCRTTGYWEVYAGVASDADFSVAVRHVETNELKWFRTRDRQSIADTEAFACTRSDDRTSPADPGGGTGGAACSGVTCLLQDDRFRLKSWYTLDGGSSQAADAISADLGESAGLFAFDSDNPELLVRIADTCSTSGYWTVYAGAASDADFSVAIRDTETNELKWFRSQGGQSVADAEAFLCGGAGGSGFDLASGNSNPRGITHAGGFFYVVDWSDEEVYAYDGTGNRVPSRDFALTVANRYPEGVAFANNRLYVVDSTDDKVYAYRMSDGGRDAAAEFDLNSDNSSPRGITHAGGFFYVVDWSDEEVYAYDGAGNRVPSRDFALTGANRYPEGVAFANSRLYVVDDADNKVYAYRLSDGGRDAAAEFNLVPDNSSPRGITYGGGYFYVVDSLDEEVYAYDSPRAPSKPDLVVSSVSSSDTSLAAGATFTLNATVRNHGNTASSATTLHYYRSFDATISSSDTQVGTDAVSALPASDSSAESISLTAPSSAGTYYYGACVDSVSGESSTGNNCSDGVGVTVDGGGDAWQVAGTGASIFDIPAAITRIRIEGEYSGRSENFVVWCGAPGDRGALLVNEILGTYRDRTTYSGIHPARREYNSAGDPCRELQIKHSVGVQWRIREVRRGGQADALPLTTSNLAGDVEAVRRARKYVQESERARQRDRDRRQELLDELGLNR